MNKFKWNYPTNMWVGENSIKNLGLACKDLNIGNPLLVTDNNFSQSKIIKDVFSKLKNDDLQVELFSNFLGNPTGKNVNDGVNFFKK